MNVNQEIRYALSWAIVVDSNNYIYILESSKKHNFPIIQT